MATKKASGHDAAEEATTTRKRSGFLDVRRSALTPSEGWISAALLLSALLVVVVAVQTSDWTDPMPRLWLVAPLGFLVGLGVAKIRSPWPAQLLLIVVALAAGVAVAFWETAGTLSQGVLADRFDETVTRLEDWGRAIGGQGISNDRLPFTMILGALTWIMAFSSSWFLFRLRWGWAAIVVLALAILTNQTYLPNSHYPLPLTFFLLFSVLLIARVHFLDRVVAWRELHLDARVGRTGFALNAAAMIGIVFALGWAIPTQKIVVQEIRDVYQTAREPWAGMEDDFERVFAGIPSKKATPLHSFGSALPLRGRISLGTAPLFTVTTDIPAYWRAQSYDVYQGQGWIATDDQRETLKGKDVYSASSDTGYRKREFLAQKVTLNSATNVIFAAGQPFEINISSEVDIATPREFEINLEGEAPSSLLPNDLAQAAERIAEARGSLSETERLLPPETRIVEERDGALVVTRDPPAVPDILAVRSGKRLKEGSSYEVVSSISIATADDLRNDLAAYPKWVTDNYLQLPDSLPERVLQLAADLTGQADNAYDKSLAIADYLRQYTETFRIDAPPVNVDAVDYFLFTQRAGYSDYFASAMTVLLRAAGVPTRLAAGYAPGVFDEASSTFTVRISDAHSWPEAYFPTYGWIPFEPSPSLVAIPRGSLEEQAAFLDIEEEIDPAFDFLLEDLFGFDDFLQDDFVLPEQATDVGGLFKSVAIKIGLAVGALFGLLVLLYVVAFMLWQVNFLGLPYAMGIYDRMAKLGAMLGISPNRYQTPGEYAALLASSADLPTEQTSTIAHGFMKARYAEQGTTGEDRLRIQQAWRPVRAALVKRLLWRVNPRRLFSRGGG
ncbi:MAG: transglutaminase domain-containing protein [Chloroflexi bacterium]|nr:transglutaminase domain-containing protein [Chloroflexota bacterium]